MTKKSRIKKDKVQEIKKREEAIREAYSNAEKFIKNEEKRESNSFRIKFI